MRLTIPDSVLEYFQWLTQKQLALTLGLLVTSCSLATAADVAEDELLAGAQSRIEKYRKADACVVVLDSSGQPVPGAEVKIEQTRHRFLFGCNIFLWGRVGNDEDEAAYRDRFSELLNFATLPFYWAAYERQQGQPDHNRIEQIARWCREHQIATKGHPLAWNHADPHWLPDDSEQIRTLQLARIDDCVGRFKGLIDRWDVVNEATHFERESFKKRAPKMTEMWEKTGRLQLVHQCFDHARKTNPQSVLLINDYRTDPAYEAVIKELAGSDGKPIYDVIGIQSHMHGGPWTNAKTWDVCERYAQFGVPLHFTETTVLSAEPGRGRPTGGQPWPSTEEGERWQARHTESFYTMLFSHPAVEAVTWWDFSDRGAWQRAPAGLLRKDLSPKLVYQRLLELIKDEWWTRTRTKTDADGKAAFRGFLGRYNVTVTAAGKPSVVRQMTVDRDDPNQLSITY